MATWEDVRQAALALPEVTEEASRETLSWRVRAKTFAWERPLRRRDLEELGDGAPDGPILGAHVADLEAKEALLAEDPAVYFTTSHFDGYKAVLVRLDRIRPAELRELLADAWLARAPATLVKRYHADHS